MGVTGRRTHSSGIQPESEVKGGTIIFASRVPERMKKCKEMPRGLGPYAVPLGMAQGKNLRARGRYDHVEIVGDLIKKRRIGTDLHCRFFLMGKESGLVKKT